MVPNTQQSSNVHRFNTEADEQVLQREGRSQVGFFDFVFALFISLIIIGWQKNKTHPKQIDLSFKDGEYDDMDLSQDSWC